MSPKIQETLKIYTYLKYIGLNLLMLLAFRDLSMFFLGVLVSWWIFLPFNKIIHIKGNEISSSALLFDLLVKYFFKKINLNDLTSISIQIDSFRTYSWKTIVIKDKHNNTISFTMSMYNDSELHNIFSYVLSKNPSIIPDEGVKEIITSNTHAIAEQMHEIYDFKMGKALLIGVILLFIINLFIFITSYY